MRLTLYIGGICTLPLLSVKRSMALWIVLNTRETTARIYHTFGVAARINLLIRIYDVVKPANFLCVYRAAAAATMKQGKGKLEKNPENLNCMCNCAAAAATRLCLIVTGVPGCRLQITLAIIAFLTHRKGQQLVNK